MSETSIWCHSSTYLLCQHGVVFYYYSSVAHLEIQDPITIALFHCSRCLGYPSILCTITLDYTGGRVAQYWGNNQPLPN